MIGSHKSRKLAHGHESLGGTREVPAPTTLATISRANYNEWKRFFTESDFVFETNSNHRLSEVIKKLS